jgi:polysaccharide export outer membrane protein
MLLRTFPCLLIVALLAGCGAGDFSGPATAEPAALRYDSASTAGSDSEEVAVASPDYELKPRDQVVFEMFNEPDVKTTQRLSSRGELTLPLIGAVTLAGLSLREAEQEVRRRYADGGYYTDPQVMLSVAEYGANFVQILGQVNRPTQVELPIEATTIGLLEAVAQAGGFTRLARTDAVRVTRKTARGAERHFTVDVRDFLGRRGGRTEEFQLQPGDVVFVPERLI